MAIAISKFINATAALYASQSLNPRRQRLMRILAKAAAARDIFSITDYVTTDAAAKSLIADSATVTKGMTADQVVAGEIYNYLTGGATSFPSTFAIALSRIRVWDQLDDDRLSKMELVLDYYLANQT